MDSTTIITAALTAFFGITVFVVVQLLQKIFIEPIQEQWRVRGEIAYTLVFYANVMDVSRRKREGLPLLELEDPITVAKSIRKLAGQLRASLYGVPFYRLLSILKLMIKRDQVIEASQSLVGWSNSIFDGDVHVHREQIVKQLRLKDIY